MGLYAGKVVHAVADTPFGGYRGGRKKRVMPPRSPHRNFASAEVKSVDCRIQSMLKNVIFTD